MNRAANTCVDIVIVILGIVIVRSSPYCRIRGSMSSRRELVVGKEKAVTVTITLI